MDHRLLRAESCLTPRQRTDALTASAGCGSPAGTRTAWRRDDLGTEGCPTNRFNINGRLAVPGDRGETAKMEVPAAVFGCSLSDQKEKEMNQNYKALCVVLCLGLTLGMAHVAFGQGERTSVTGTVTDNTQAIVVDASVTIRDRATHVQTKTTTNSAGLYFITNLPPGNYDLTVEKTGFEISTVTNIPLTLTLVATINVTLHVGSITQTVSVMASAVQLESQTSALQSTITTRAVEDLPNISASPLSYAALVPNVVPTTGQQALGNAVIGSATTAQMGGGLAQQNGYLVDGAESRGTNENGTAYSVPLEAVSE
ncbi:MAG: carboxypeptidase-like regulatory domain-containing protein, partial [Bryobacteraceae bacterium]